MAYGRVKWFNEARGFGFIERATQFSLSPTVEEIFVHYSAIGDGGTEIEGFKTLEPGQLVEFDIYESPKGKTAKNVVPSGKS